MNGRPCDWVNTQVVVAGKRILTKKTYPNKLARSHCLKSGSWESYMDYGVVVKFECPKCTLDHDVEDVILEPGEGGICVD